MKIKCSILRLISASAIGFGLVGESNAQPAWTFYTNTLTPDHKVTADTSKPGFIWNVFANQAKINSRERTEEALSGRVMDAFGVLLENLADTNAQGVALAPASPLSSSNATARFEIETVINLNHTGGNSSGNFSPDDQMPGVPATDSSTAGIAAEVITYLNLPAGLTRMGFMSDDAFWVTAGKVHDAFDAIYVGARQPSDAVFYLNVSPEELVQRNFAKNLAMDYRESGMDLGLSADTFDKLPPIPIAGAADLQTAPSHLRPPSSMATSPSKPSMPSCGSGSKGKHSTKTLEKINRCPPHMVTKDVTPAE